MSKERITITLEKKLLQELDGLVDGRNIRSRSHAIEQALFSHLEESKVKQALILAGGEGTRLRPFTYEIPKPLIPIKGKPMLEHIITHLASYGVKKFVLSVGYMSEKIISHFGDGTKFGVNIEYIIEKERLGTAGPLRLAKDYLDGDFLMLNGDILSRVNITEFFTQHQKMNGLGTMVLVAVKDPSKYGTVALHGNKIMKFVEKPKKGKAVSNLVNGGIYLLKSDVIDYVPKKGFSMIEKDVFPKLAQEGKLYGYVYTGQWYDLGTMESYERAIKKWDVSDKQSL